ncbi:MAG: Quinolinate phosphoribosyl transferase [Candidatus Levybacteria bacterium GW2011_GWA2_40_8]|nr:MAG: Quinolinate phosphoribosyl transferase [Candidatus Levybacteria bacterium GW2011_GWA2_40_8]
MQKYWDSKTIDKIRKGYYSAVYFDRARQILLKEKNLKPVTMQIFQKKNDVLLCGVNEVVELLKIGTGYFKNGRWVSRWKELSVKAVPEGKIVNSFDSVMHITGPYAYFAHLESLYLGILARKTKIATNVRVVVRASKGKPVLFFADRYDYFLNQEQDGYAALLGGASLVCTPAQAFYWNKNAVGTIPHALIAMFDGNTIETAKMFAKHFPKVPLIIVVDFDNDCVETSLKVAKALNKKLWGVRLDTSESLIDVSLGNVKRGSSKGVNPLLVKRVREALNKEKFNFVKIIVSGGFTKEKIELFEKMKVPVDAYAVGSALMEGKYDFTADVVKVDNKKIAKTGRVFKLNRQMRDPLEHSELG